MSPHARRPALRAGERGCDGDGKGRDPEGAASLRPAVVRACACACACARACACALCAWPAVSPLSRLQCVLLRRSESTWCSAGGRRATPWSRRAVTCLLAAVVRQICLRATALFPCAWVSHTRGNASYQATLSGEAKQTAERRDGHAHSTPLIICAGLCPAAAHLSRALRAPLAPLARPRALQPLVSRSRSLSFSAPMSSASSSGAPDPRSKYPQPPFKQQEPQEWPGWEDKMSDQAQADEANRTRPAGQQQQQRSLVCVSFVFQASHR